MILSFFIILPLFSILFLRSPKICIYKTSSRLCIGEYEEVMHEDNFGEYAKSDIEKNSNKIISIKIAETLSKPISLNSYAINHVILSGNLNYPGIEVIDIPKSIELSKLYIRNKVLSGKNIEIKNVLFRINSTLNADILHADPTSLYNSKINLNVKKLETEKSLNLSQLESKFVIGELHVTKACDVDIGNIITVDGIAVPKAETYSFSGVQSLMLLEQGEGNPLSNVHINIQTVPNFITNLQSDSLLKTNIAILSEEYVETIPKGDYNAKSLIVRAGKIENGANIIQTSGGVVITSQAEGTISTSAWVVLDGATIEKDLTINRVAIVNNITFKGTQETDLFLRADELTFASQYANVFLDFDTTYIRADKYIRSDDTYVPHILGDGMYIEYIKLANGPKLTLDDQTKGRPFACFKDGFDEAFISKSFNPDSLSHINLMNSTDGVCAGLFNGSGSDVDTNTQILRQDRLAAGILVIVAFLYILVLITSNLYEHRTSRRDLINYRDIVKDNNLQEREMDDIISAYEYPGPLDYDSTIERYKHINRWKELELDKYKLQESLKACFCCKKCCWKPDEQKAEIMLALVLEDQKEVEDKRAFISRINDDSTRIQESLSMGNIQTLCNMALNLSTNEEIFKKDLLRASYYTFEFMPESIGHRYSYNPDSVIVIPLTGYANKSDLRTNEILHIEDNVSVDTLRAFTNLYVIQGKTPKQIQKMKFDEINNVPRDYPWEDVECRHVIINPRTFRPCLINPDTQKLYVKEKDRIALREEITEVKNGNSLNVVDYYIQYVEANKKFPSWRDLLWYIYHEICLKKKERPTLPRQVAKQVSFVVQDYERMFRTFYLRENDDDEKHCYLLNTMLPIKNMNEEEQKIYDGMVKVFLKRVNKSTHGYTRLRMERKMADNKVDNKFNMRSNRFLNSSDDQKLNQAEISTFVHTLGSLRLNPNREELLMKCFSCRIIDNKDSIYDAVPYNPNINRVLIPTMLKKNININPEIFGLNEKATQEEIKKHAVIYFRSLTTSPWPIYNDPKNDINEIQNKTFVTVFNAFGEYASINLDLPRTREELTSELLAHIWYNYYDPWMWPLHPMALDLVSAVCDWWFEPNSFSEHESPTHKYMIEATEEFKKEASTKVSEVISNYKSFGDGKELEDDEVEEVIERNKKRLGPEELEEKFNLYMQQSGARGVLKFIPDIYFNVIDSYYNGYKMRVPIDGPTDKTRAQRAEKRIEAVPIMKAAYQSISAEHREDIRVMVYAQLAGLKSAVEAGEILGRHIQRKKVFKTEVVKVSKVTGMPERNHNPYSPLDPFKAFIEAARYIVEHEGHKKVPNKEEVLGQLARMSIPHKVALLPSNINEIINSVIAAYRKEFFINDNTVESDLKRVIDIYDKNSKL